MNRYSDYKFSGIDWLGNIPSHWILTKNRFGFKKKTNGYNESIKTNVLSLTTNGIKIKNDLTFGKTTNSYIGHQLVKKGDLVFTPRDFDQTPILSDVSEFDGCISNLYIVDETNENVFNHYVNYFWYGLKYSVDFFKNFSNGMRFSFNRFQFDEIPLLVPPIQEQKLISNYLDKKIGLIESLIEKIKKKIELINKQRTSLINQRVTKGLDPNVEMKDSGVEWIGKIPKHWDTKKIKYLGTIKSGEGINISSLLDEGQYPVYGGNGIVGNFSEYNVEDTVIIIGRVGEKCGNVHLVKNKSWISDNSLILELFDSNYYNWVSISLDTRDLNKLRNQSSQPLITGTQVKNEIIPLPPQDEIKKISDFINRQSELLFQRIKIENKRLKIFKEYRESLISSVVTGKVRVTEDMI